ncbi:glycoside hydrolase family 11 protein [Pseudobacteroides cellulosolvens]|uniref:Endo-1,4-beta-xylanase n=1 Tax=Pseudobacteroides cellulosolvens ATCC 35603 = DSM 2933 TaxID=398512 RepID=A0A0L6JJL7_9FIRM|nr:glycoside hydrolase family 11 protein [Pseudobacteroides cellulosolvens]KNY25597.1 Endo-1,4-beta-xylanase [Pseudobacteroides cellulosolvens ATCC 35603 = DSM 2933]
MKQKTLVNFVRLLTFSLVFALCTINVQAATTLTSNQTGTQDNYNYELWKDYGTTSMTLNSGGTFNCQWSNIGNALFRKGKKFDATKTHQQIGNMSINYASTFNPGGNSYLCVYGWTKSSLIEFYIVDNWGTYRPTGTFKGTITVDGGTYDIYQTTRVNQPSIIGNTTFYQYWSVRQSKRTSGTISVSEHFKKWESLGMPMGKLYEVAFTVEGYQSSGSANVTTNTLTIGGSSATNTNTYTATPAPTSYSSTTARTECESMAKGGQYTGNISSPFSGVALYGNNDLVKFTKYFSTGTHSFSLRGCSNNSNMARVDLKIGGVTKGTFYFGGSYPAVYTINNVSHGTGNQEIQLVCTSDNGQWDAFLDYLEIK